MKEVEKMAELTKDTFFQYEQQFVSQVLMSSDLRERAEGFTNIMQRARELDLEQGAYELAQSIAADFGEPELWELPVPFEKDVQYQPFPVESLPKILSDYLTAVCTFVQVSPDMAVLPLLSVLSLCLQGKVVVAYPANAHAESVNIYTLTVAPPGERKSAAFKALVKPVEEYVRKYNERHYKSIEEYKSKRQFFERQKQNAMSGKSANLERVLEITRELCDLEPIHEMQLICSDTTPEALAAEMFKQGGCMAVMDDEGGVFDIMSGLYTNGQGNINLFLKGYDGSPHTIFRRTSENITLDSPYLTIGIMTQPQQFMQAMSNPQFVGRGLMQRFIFAFPAGKAGTQSYSSADIPPKIQQAYDELIANLLRMPKHDSPSKLKHSKESYHILHDYYDLLQTKMRSGGMFENMKAYASKHFGKVLKIAGLLHLCEHSVDEPIGGDTAMKAVSIGLWAENTALKAFNGEAGDDTVIRNAKYIIKRVKSDRSDILSLTRLKRLCRAVSDSDDFGEAVELLEDMHYLRRERIETAGRPSEKYHINPFI